MPEWHRALWVSISVCMFKAGCLEPYPAGFWHSQGWQFHSLSGHLFQCLSSLKVKENIFLPFKWSFLYFTLCPLPPILSVHSSEKTLAPPPLLTHFYGSPFLLIRPFSLFCYFLSWLSHQMSVRRGPLLWEIFKKYWQITEWDSLESSDCLC